MINPARKRYCAHYTANYLPLTANWIYRSVINHVSFDPVFLCRTKQNISHFPLDKLYSLQDLSAFKRVWQIFCLKTIGYIPFFKRMCNAYRVEIFHAHFGYQGAKSLGLTKKLNVPLICSFYGDDAFASMHEGKYAELFAGAEKILVLGLYMKARLIKLGCPPDKLVIHHLGIDVDEIKFVSRKSDINQPLRFLIASSFLEKKGIEIAIKALGQLKEQFNFTLDIIGDGPLKAQLLEEIATWQLESRVQLHGYKPYAEVISMAHSCDVFIQASRTTKDNRKEGTPMAIVDMMATGMPVVSTNHSDIPEIVKDGINGFLANENDVESLRQCLEKVFTNRSALENLGMNARKWVEEEFSVKRQTERLEKIYDQAIEAHTR